MLSPKPLTLRGALPHYLSLKNELASKFIWKVENDHSELGIWAKEISTQIVEGAAWFLAAFSKMLEERDKLKERLFKQER